LTCVPSVLWPGVRRAGRQGWARRWRRASGAVKAAEPWWDASRTLLDLDWPPPPPAHRGDHGLVRDPPGGVDAADPV